MDGMNQPGDGKGNTASIVIRGIGICVGIVLLAVGGWVGVETWQSLEIITFPKKAFSVAAILLGSFSLWLGFKSYEKV